MAKSDYNIADQTGASFLLDMNNNILPSIATNNSSDVAPVAANGVAVGMLWYNSGSDVSGIPAGTVGVCTAVSGGAGTWTPVQTTVDDSLTSISTTVALSSNGGKTLKDVQDGQVTQLAALPTSLLFDLVGTELTITET